MKKRKLFNSDNGVVGIVVAVLLIGLMVSVIALIQTQYVPQWMKEKEAEHMEEVIDQFTRMKFAIDTQIATEINTPIATTITLGSKEMPYLVSQRSYGQLDILKYPDSGFSFLITATDLTNTIIYDSNDINGDVSGIGTIQYSSSNAYYIDQSFIYEAGAIITYQDDGSDMTIQPAIQYDVTNDVLTIRLVDIKDVGGKIQSSGYGSTAILSEYSTNLIDNTQSTDTEYITDLVIVSNYYLHWFNLFYNLLPNTIADVDYDESTKTVNVDFTSSNVELDIIVYEVKAQIGPGWVQ